MHHDNQQLLQHLQTQINELAEQVNHYKDIKLQGACFDDLLFKPLSIKRTGYQQYLQEINDNYQKLQQLIVNKQNLTEYADQIAYLAEKLINQISALSRELVTHKNITKKTQLTHTTIFEKHAQYLGYLRKLEWMKSELENNQANQQKRQQLDERINRCQTAIKMVEDEIELFEQSF